jgi:nitrogen-specific signal transduction histidine kinase/ActR/RegA family two-component response regulator
MIHSSAIVHEGKKMGVRGFVMNATQQKKLEEQLLHSQKMESVGHLAGGIAHDFNNILTAILGFGNTLKMKMQNDSPLRSYVDHILSSTGKAASLTQRLLAFSRKQVIEPRPIDLNNVIKNIEPLLSKLISKNIKIKMELCEGKLMVNADAGQIEQVIMNLVTNARDVMPKGGELVITGGISEIDNSFIRTNGFGEIGEYVLFSVKDSGTGIDKELKDEIFEPFFTTKKVGKGTGLGLSMVYGMIKQHNGFITVNSEVRQGTRFDIYLPKIEASEEVDNCPKALPPNKGTETILLADDEEMIRQLTKEIFEDFGYKIYEAADGNEAVELFKERKDEIDMLIVDLIMPKKNGMKVYEEVMRISPDTKILFTSGYDEGMISEVAGNIKDLELILKPFSAYKIMGKVREMLDKGQKENELTS